MKWFSGQREFLACLLAAVIVWASCAFVLGQSTGPVFSDVTEQAGLVYQQHDFAGCEGVHLFFCEAVLMSGGAAVGDFDGDGFDDLYVTRLDASDLLFRNRGDGTFEDVTAQAGLADFSLLSNGAGWGDVDRDGDLDLYVTAIGSTRFLLFINDGEGQFQEEGLLRGAAVETSNNHAGFGVAFGDYDLDGWLDVFVGEWGNAVVSRGAPHHSRLLRNRGAEAPGFFEDVSQESGVVIGERSWVFSPAFVDLDSDGFPDLALASDFGTSRIFWNNGDGTFHVAAGESGVGSDENGMGSTFGDFDGDGDLDWFVSSIYDPEISCPQCNWGRTGNRLYRNEGGRLFVDWTDEAGVRDGGWGWGSLFFDVDNDADLDLTMTNGMDFPDDYFDPLTVEDIWEHDVMRLWSNDGPGAMAEKALESGLAVPGSGKGLLTFDYDNDGDLDIFVVNNLDGGRLYRNEGGNQQDWLRVQAFGTVSNRESLGAVVRVQVTEGGPWQIRHIGVAAHYLGQSERVAHFGLGSGQAPVWRVVVQWPSGQELIRSQVPRNSTIRLTEPRPRPIRPTPPRFPRPRIP
ncbi:MAG TPA: CRTAC1 family protein [Acidobacteriota bacterium]|nr:CRTAC1 family protein [Acidobacteriota bacterium]